MNTNILAAVLPFFQDVLHPSRQDGRGRPIRQQIEAVDLSKVAGMWHSDYSRRNWGELLHGRVNGRPLMKRLPEALEDLKQNPSYYLGGAPKSGWVFCCIEDVYYVSAGHHRTVVGRAFMELNGLKPVVQGVLVVHFDRRSWNELPLASQAPEAVP